VVKAHGGIVHRAHLHRAGATRYAVQAALQRGDLVRIRRDWVAERGCPPDLLRAVRIGGRLTCVSAAQHLKVWVIDDDRFHVAASPSASRLQLVPAKSERARPAFVHWSIPAVAVTSKLAIEPLENILVHLARCQSHENAVAAIDSALNQGLVRRAQLLRLATTVGGRFAAAVEASDARAASGLETLPRLRLALRGVPMVPQVRIDGHDVDGLIGERLVLQFDGDMFHSTAPARQRDRREDARLALQGFTVLRYGTPDVMDNWQATEDEILSAMAQGLHLWPESQPLRPTSQEIIRIAGRPMPI
jgi:very-short-patch-repair endonuclease